MLAEKRVSLLRPVLFALAFVGAIVFVFYFGIAAVKKTLDESFATERALADTQRFADLAIRRQLYEENAIRGFVGSGRRVFLEPYATASREFDVTIDALSNALVRSGLADEQTSVAQAAATNRQWQVLVARPLLADRHRADLTFVEVRGKTLVDRFRAEIAHVDHAERARAALETTAAALAVSRVGVLGVLAVLVVAFVLIVSLRAQSRLGRELMVERRVAAAMQRGLLQSTLPNVPAIVFDASYVPAGREAFVGGDWYDVLALPDGRVMFSIGDVAGHGVDAAVVMSRAREAIVALGYDASDPALVLARANDVLILQHSAVATAIFGYVDPQTGAIAYASAGHPPPVLVAPGAAPAFLPYGGMPLGIVKGQTFVCERVTAGPGAAIVLYTDGFTERTRDLFQGERDLVAAVAKASLDGNVGLATRIHHEIFGDAVPGDDAAVVTIAFVAAPVRFRDEDGDAEAPVEAPQNSGARR